MMVKLEKPILIIILYVHNDMNDIYLEVKSYSSWVEEEE